MGVIKGDTRSLDYGSSESTFAKLATTLGSLRPCLEN